MANEDTVLEEAMDNLKEAGQRIRATQSLMRSQLAYAILRPPSLEDAPQIFAEANSLEERLGRLIEELYAF